MNSHEFLYTLLSEFTMRHPIHLRELTLLYEGHTKTPINERAIRKMIAELVDKGFLVGSVPSSGGYFAIATNAEYTAARGDLCSRIAKLQKRLSNLDKSWESRKVKQEYLF